MEGWNGQHLAVAAGPEGSSGHVAAPPPAPKSESVSVKGKGIYPGTITIFLHLLSVVPRFRTTCFKENFQKVHRSKGWVNVRTFWEHSRSTKISAVVARSAVSKGRVHTHLEITA